MNCRETLEMNKWKVRSAESLVLILLTVMAADSAVAQRAGQSISVQYGVVSGVRQVNLDSNAVPAGAIVGGTVGLVTASGKSSGKKARNAIIGTAAGATIGSAARGPKHGMLYSVQTGSTGMIQVVSDQREIRIGDCVAVEQARDTANVRRVSAAYCESANQKAVEAVRESAHAEAAECLKAKQQLVEAGTPEAVELATIKLKLLCAD
ncbi:MAG: hypothetical protein RQ729_10050 [Wenzhouxiangellaceae bacterium]|nr:hypothetical protein [Wenzhouxiangellaceae bacterium]